MPNSDFPKQIAQNILEKEDEFNALVTGPVQLSTSDKWLLMILNQEYGAALYGIDRTVRLAEKFKYAIEQVEEDLRDDQGGEDV